MTINEIAAAIASMPVDSIDQVLCVDVAHTEDGIYVVGGWYLASTPTQAAEVVQDLA
jgi:hypothetical protein